MRFKLFNSRGPVPELLSKINETMLKYEIEKATWLS